MIEIKSFLDDQVEKYNQPLFIKDDPISIPHRFTLKQDIEISGFWVSILAWGQRKTIINKSNELIELMDGAPYQFIKEHQEKDRLRFSKFKHRTFQYTDTLYFLDFLQRHYSKSETLETAFLQNWRAEDEDIENALIGFYHYFFNVEYAPKRTRKHIASPDKKSRCKRLCMFLRWMVRSDEKRVDFGIWDTLKTSQLCLPLDVHVEYAARRLGLISRKQNDWNTVKELSRAMRQFNPDDPTRYDYALFGLGLNREETDFILI